MYLDNYNTCQILVTMYCKLQTKFFFFCSQSEMYAQYCQNTFSPIDPLPTSFITIELFCSKLRFQEANRRNMHETFQGCFGLAKLWYSYRQFNLVLQVVLSVILIFLLFFFVFCFFIVYCLHLFTLVRYFILKKS